MGGGSTSHLSEDDVVCEDLRVSIRGLPKRSTLTKFLQRPHHYQSLLLDASIVALYLAEE
jgi:hypothetical protein